MKMYLISDNVDTLTGMRLAGIDGVVVHETQEVEQQLDKILKRPRSWRVVDNRKIRRFSRRTS